MFPFLKSVARWIYQHYPQNTDKLVIILPTRRSGHFLKHYLTQFYPNAIWAPEMLTINDWVISGTSGRMAEPTELLVSLYQLYRKHNLSPTIFEEFMQWGDMILQDFDEVDKNMIPAAQLFQNMIDLQQIQDDFSYLTENQIAAIKQFHQNFSTLSDSELKRKISGLWELFPVLYDDFTQELTKQQLFYEGLAYKMFAESVEMHLKDDKDYLFVGFNALYESELKILKAAQKKGNSMFFWDYDHFYLDDEDHEAGRFIRQQLALFPPPDDFSDDENPSASSTIRFNSLLKADKQLHSYHLSSLVGQTNLAGQLISGQLENYNNEPDYLAVVLPDESLLPALLNQLPQTVETFNISMGFPLRGTQAAILINQLGQVQKLMQLREDGSFAAYKPALTEFLSHDYLIPFSREILNSFSKSNRQYISSKRLEGLPAELLRLLPPASNGTKQLEALLIFIDWLILGDLPGLPEQEKEFSYQVSRSLRSLQNLLAPIRDEIQSDTVFRLINKLLRKEKIPFRGEPLSGIQLIGLLETRLIDFKRIIFLSVNEGYFPPSGITPSFIPYSLRTGFNLMTRDRRDAIYAYYFYRAIQRAEQVHLLIPDGTEAGSRTEASRYIAQLHYSDKFTLNQHLTGHSIRFPEKSPIRIKKDKNQFQSFHYQNDKNGRILSPTALNAYIDCSLRFYFNYILRLSPEIEKSENIDAMEFGNIIHDCMHRIYSKEKEVRSEYPGSLRKDEHALRKLLLDSFEQNHYAVNGVIDVPENLLIFENMLMYLKELLKADEQYAPFTILAVEENLRKTLVVDSDEPFSVLLGGQVDRIDEKSGIIRIIDYKTGRDENHFKAVEDLFQSKKDRQKAILQAFLYAEAFLEDHPEAIQIEGHILNLKKSFNHDFDSCIHQDGNPVNYKAIRFEFMNQMQQLMTEIFNTETYFEQTEDSSKCKYCDFAGICKR